MYLGTQKKLFRLWIFIWQLQTYLPLQNIYLILHYLVANQDMRQTWWLRLLCLELGPKIAIFWTVHLLQNYGLTEEYIRYIMIKPTLFNSHPTCVSTSIQVDSDTKSLNDSRMSSIKSLAWNIFDINHVRNLILYQCLKLNL